MPFRSWSLLLIYKSLQAAKTLDVLPPQDEPSTDTIPTRRRRALRAAVSHAG
jgi:hypothetical protein